MSHHYDAIVLGLGGMGSAALYHLARRGRRVLGLEQFPLAHNLGSSHGKTRVIRQAYFEHPDYVPLAVRAYELWRELERESGRELLVITGGLFLGRPDSGVVAGTLRSARRHGLAHEVLSPAEIRQRFPAFHPGADEAGVYEAVAGVLFPEECVRTHVELALRRGAEARFGVRVLGWQDLAGGGVRVETADGTYTAGRLVVTAGPWAGQVLARLHLPLTVTRQVVWWFDPAGPADHYEPGRFPVFIWEVPGHLPFYGFPNLRGQGVKAGIHGIPDVVTPDTVHREVDPGEVEALRALMAGRMPGFMGRVREASACLYTMTPDAHFIVGPVPGTPQVIVAAGFSGHGFKFASTVGEVLADLVVDGATRHPIGLFHPGRFRA